MEDFVQCEKFIRWYIPRHVVFRKFPVKDTPPKISKKFLKISQNFPKYYFVLNIMIEDENRVIWALRHIKAFMQKWLNLKASKILQKRCQITYSALLTWRKDWSTQKWEYCQTSKRTCFFQEWKHLFFRDVKVFGDVIVFFASGM